MELMVNFGKDNRNAAGASSIKGSNIMHLKEPAFGIDLGTTNSCISVCSSGESPETIKLLNDKITLPSCVRWDGENKFTVGEEAYNERYMSNVAYSVKRKMGKDDNITFIRGEETLILTPAEVSAKILIELVRQASLTMYKNINDCVITVPAYFDHNQVKDTLEAGKLAGLNVLEIMREPTSAALLYNQHEMKSGTKEIMVYDLGGGTFDISVVRISMHGGKLSDSLIRVYNIDPESSTANETRFSVIVTNGDMLLGGDDIDTEMCKLVINKMKLNGVNTDAMTKEQYESLKLKLEKFKKYGENLYNFEIMVGSTIVKSTLTPAEMRSAYQVIFNRTKVLMDKVLRNPSVRNISQVVTVGGSTKSEIIREMLREYFDFVIVNSNMNPDESVGLGAGIEAKRLKFGGSRVNIFESLPLSIGILGKGTVNKIIPAGTQIPKSKTEIYTTMVDNQTKISIDVYQGNSQLPEECAYLGRLDIQDIEPKEVGKTFIYVTLTVDSNGILTATVEVDGKRKQLELTSLLGRNTGSKLKQEDMKLIRWKKYVKNYSGPYKQKLEDALNRYIGGFGSGELIKLITDSKSSIADPTSTISMKRNIDSSNNDLDDGD